MKNEIGQKEILMGVVIFFVFISISLIPSSVWCTITTEKTFEKCQMEGFEEIIEKIKST